MRRRAQGGQVCRGGGRRCLLRVGAAAVRRAPVQGLRLAQRLRVQGGAAGVHIRARPVMRFVSGGLRPWR